MAIRFCPHLHTVATRLDQCGQRCVCEHGDKLTHYSVENVTRNTSGYFTAPCEICAKPVNVGNYPPVLASLNHYGVRCSGHLPRG